MIVYKPKRTVDKQTINFHLRNGQIVQSSKKKTTKQNYITNTFKQIFIVYRLRHFVQEFPYQLILATSRITDQNKQRKRETALPK